MNVLDKLIFNLQTIATIPRGRRIGTAKEFLVIEDDSPIQSFWRWKNAESRDKAVIAICKEIRTIIAFAEYMLEIIQTVPSLPAAADDRGTEGPMGSITSYKRHSADLKKIYVALLGAVTGINNLCITYDSDADVAGHLRPLFSEIHICVQRILTVIPEKYPRDVFSSTGTPIS